MCVLCRGLISGVIVLLNFVLKSILQWLVVFEKHWTQSDKVGQRADSRGAACHVGFICIPICCVTRLLTGNSDDNVVDNCAISMLQIVNPFGLRLALCRSATTLCWHL